MAEFDEVWLSEQGAGCALHKLMPEAHQRGWGLPPSVSEHGSHDEQIRDL
jgi:hypothetical protein